MPGEIKIAYFLDTPLGLGGAGNVLLEQADLMSWDAEVIVCIPCNEERIPNPEYVRRCEIKNLKWAGLNYSTSPYPEYIDAVKAFASYEQILKFCIQNKINFLHSVQFHTAAELVSRELRIPHLMNIYQNWTEETLTDLGKYLPLPSYHVSDSMLYSRFWAKVIGSKPFCVRPGAPLDHFCMRAEKGFGFRILMLGMLCERKNQMAAIWAVESCIMQGYPFEFTIAGRCDNEYGRKCRDYIATKNLTDRIHLIGFCSEVDELLKSHDVILCSSTQESFPCSLVEAATYGCMVISTPVAGVPEIFQNGINAYISEDYHAQSLADCIISCYRDIELGNDSKIRANLYQTWKEHFSQDVIRGQLQTIYTQIREDCCTAPKQRQQDYSYMEIVRTIYEKLRDKYGEKNQIYPDPKSRSFYYYYMQKSIRSGTAYIWGAGKYGSIAKDILECIFPMIELKGFIDAKKTGIYEGKEVISTEMLQQKVADYIVIGFCERKEQAVSKLKNIGYFYGKNLWILP